MRFLQPLGFAVIAGAVLAAAVYALMRWIPFGEYPGEAFFDLAAQTIPILLVALAVEAQARQFDLERTGKMIRIAAVVFLACGETTAVVVSAGLYEPDPRTAVSDLLVVITALGLLGGFFAVIAVALRTSTHLNQSSAGPAADQTSQRSAAATPTTSTRRHKSASLLPVAVGSLIAALLMRGISATRERTST